LVLSGSRRRKRRAAMVAVWGIVATASMVLLGVAILFAVED
jgi:hypothetical protein